MTNINPIGLGLPSESVESLGELYFKSLAAPVTIYPVPSKNNSRRANTFIHHLPNGREIELFTNNISMKNRKPAGEKWTPNNARKQALNLEEELKNKLPPKGRSRTRKIRSAKK
jgi:hypothetical protein